ncbi:hypothetical protein [Ruminococcus sp.]|jgi:hypothetical protein|uniref:hypothetical protein n=1 Tax=Ruminococcus sp. TaxID=41978 RepID=UPI0025F1C1E8|nr:hypothetical protein [Ruminococcus sp.]
MDSIEQFKEEKGEKAFLYMLIGFLAGIVVGFIASPVKNGIAIGSYNGANNKFKNSNNGGNRA